MFRNFILITWRNLVRDARFTLINVSGLAVGMAAFFLILLWVFYQFSYDTFHEDSDRIYKVMADRSQEELVSIESNTTYPLADVLKEYAFFESVGRILRQGDILLTTDDFRQEEYLHFADQGFLDTFDFEMLEGDPTTALKNQLSIVLTKSMADKYFPLGDALGKEIRLKTWSFETQLMVTGILEDIPDNSSITFNFLVPIELMAGNVDWMNHWGTASLTTFVKLKPGIQPEMVDPEITDIPGKYHTWEYDLFLFPATKMFLYNVFKDRAGGGRITYVYVFIVAAILILLLACINFTNMSTAYADRRAREIGIRKTMGAGVGNVRRQFLIESIIISMIAMIAALSIIQLVLPAYNQLLKTNFNDVWQPEYILAMFLIALFTGIAAGIYPAFVLSRFNPQEVLKSSFGSRTRLHWTKQALIVFQLATSFVMITAAVVIYAQVRYLNNSEIGFDRENLLYFYIHQNGIYEHQDDFLNRLTNLPEVSEASYMSENPLLVYQKSGDPEWEGKDPNKAYPPLAFIDSDRNVTDVLRLEILEGRDFSMDFSTDTAAFLINERAAELIGTDAVGKEMSFWDKEGKIVGIFKNFHHLSFHSEINPMIIRSWKENSTMCFVRFNKEELPALLEKLEVLFYEYEKDYPFTYNFMEEDFASLYTSEHQVQILTTAFATIAIVISVLGLYGLIAFVLNGQIKMIGIRKVLGASIWELLVLLAGKFTRWVFLSIVFAIPLSYYLLQNWLNRFVYHINMGFSMFLVAGMIVLTITFVVIISMVIRSARANPVESLKYE